MITTAQHADSFRKRPARCLSALAFLVLWVFTGTQAAASSPRTTAFPGEEIVLISLGDSLTQGTMNATNNAANTSSAYMQKVYESLRQVVTVRFSQPLLDNRGRRLFPFIPPTNLGVDGSDIYSLEGKEYHKRSWCGRTYRSRDYLCDRPFPRRHDDLYDAVLYPLNLLALKPVSQLDAALWLLNRTARRDHASMSVVILWIGNNDSSHASLGLGSGNPTLIPIPLDLLEGRLNPAILQLLRSREGSGLISFEPYRFSSIERTLTEADDFADQYHRILTRLKTEVTASAAPAIFFLCTLPYYTSVGYLMDSEDIEYYLRKADDRYTLPPSFKRAPEEGTTAPYPPRGDRISLFTLLSMYLLLLEGHSVSFVNQALELNGEQRDGLVLAEDEQHYIMARIDSFNAVIRGAAEKSDLPVHLIDTGQTLNEILTGARVLTLNDRLFTRRWGRGNSFSLDGVHPAHTTQAFMANLVIEHLNAELGLNAPLHDLSSVAKDDPYVDNDGDGFVPGPCYEASGFGELLLLFRDPDDGDSAVIPVLPPDIWNRITALLLEEFIL